MVPDRLSGSDVENGFLLGGYPRTTAQVDYLDAILVKGAERGILTQVDGIGPVCDLIDRLMVAAAFAHASCPFQPWTLRLLGARR